MNEKPICGDCKKPCKPSYENIGIGSYEYWGQKCVDNRYEWISDCCDAEVFTDESLGEYYDAPHEDEIQKEESYNVSE